MSTTTSTTTTDTTLILKNIVAYVVIYNPELIDLKTHKYLCLNIFPFNLFVFPHIMFGSIILRNFQVEFYIMIANLKGCIDVLFPQMIS